jgi:hypothetical protein
MSSKIERLARKLGAEVVGEVHDYSAGAFGVAQLAQTLRDRLEPGRGKRPGRPSNPAWSKRTKVPLGEETETRLKALAGALSDERRKVSPMQVAAQILEEATASYFSRGRAVHRLEDELLDAIAAVAKRQQQEGSPTDPHEVARQILGELKRTTKGRRVAAANLE